MAVIEREGDGWFTSVREMESGEMKERGRDFSRIHRTR